MLKSISKKTWIVMGIAAAVFVALAVGVFMYLKMPSGYISLDVNPSIEIQTNRLGEVVAVIAVNKDAEAVLKGYRADSDLEDVIEDIVDRMVLTGYLNSKEETPILITVDGKTIGKDFQNRINQDVKKALEARKVLGGILNNSINLEEYNKDKAHDSNVSVGKYAIIEKLLAEDPTLTLEELSGTSVEDLIQYALEKGISVDELFDEYFDELGDMYEEKMEKKREELEKKKDQQEEEKDRKDDMDDADDKDDKDDLNDPDDRDDKYDKDDDDDRDDKYDDDDRDDKDDDDDDRRNVSKKKQNKPAQKAPVKPSNQKQDRDDDDDDRYEKDDDKDDKDDDKDDADDRDDDKDDDDRDEDDD